jgi:hypothetical protein
MASPLTNTFVRGDVVKTTNNTRTDGVVFVVACSLATKAGGKTCDPKTCAHPVKDYVWVLWPGSRNLLTGATTTYSHHYTELEYDGSKTSLVGAAKASTPSDTPVPDVPAKEDTKKKDDYLENAKQVIKSKITAESQAEFWKNYNGFTRLKYDRSGRPFVVEAAPIKPPIPGDEVDWDVYHGRKKGPLRKATV